MDKDIPSEQKCHELFGKKNKKSRASLKETLLRGDGEMGLRGYSISSHTIQRLLYFFGLITVFSRTEFRPFCGPAL